MNTVTDSSFVDWLRDQARRFGPVGNLGRYAQEHADLQTREALQDRLRRLRKDSPLRSALPLAKSEWDRKRDAADRVRVIRCRKAFAAANGWHLTDNVFTFAALRDSKKSAAYGRRIKNGGWCGPGYDCGYGVHSALDHRENYRASDQVPACIIGQPYCDLANEQIQTDVREYFAAFGLTIHCRPPDHSWHFPGWTSVVAVTRPDTEVRWPALERGAVA